MNNPNLLSFCTIKESELVFTLQSQKIVNSQNKRTEYNDLTKVQKYKGEISHTAKKTIESRLTSWFTAMKVFNDSKQMRYKRKPHKPVFITLTLSDQQTDDDIFMKRKMLELFLKRMRYQESINQYLWKAERQNNGNLHFHIVSDTYIDKEKIQKNWNEVQGAKKYLKKYEDCYNSIQAPSTHIRSIDHMKKSVRYCMKYVSKKEDNKPIKGRIYSNSKSLVGIKPFTFQTDGVNLDKMYKFIETKKIDSFTGDWFSLFRFDEMNPVDLLPTTIRNNYFAYYLSLYKDLYPDTNPSLINDIFCEYAA